MLIVSRRVGERIVIGEGIVVEVLEVGGGAVRLGVQAPATTRIHREEVWLAIQAENEAAAASDVADLPRPRPRSAR